MLKENLQKLNITVLGAINGVLLALSLEVFFRVLYVWYLYDEYVESLQPRNSEVHICSSFIVKFDFRYYSTLLLMAVSVVFASFLIGKSLPHLRKTTILFWQLIGILTVGWSFVLGKMRIFLQELLKCGKLSCIDAPVIPSFSEFYVHLLPQLAFLLIFISAFNFVFSLFVREPKQRIL